MRILLCNFCISQQLRLLAVHRGIGAMEIVAMDMKVSGMYIARQLSFSGVSFRIEEIALDEEFKVVYNKAARLVRDCRLSPSERDCAAEGTSSHAGTQLLYTLISYKHTLACFRSPSCISM